MNLVEFKQAYHLHHHILPKKFKFDDMTQSDIPLCQKEYLRSPSCATLIKLGEEKCTDCSKFELKVRSQFNLKRKINQTQAAPKAPITFTSPERIALTLKSERNEIKKLKMENNRLTEILNSSIKTRSVHIQSELNDDLVDIFQGIPEENVPPFMRLFWTEQQKYIRTQNKSQIRYHPLIVKYCLSIAAKSSSAYDQLMNSKDGSGVLVLPSQRTLRNYRNYIKPQQGFNPQVIADLTKKTVNFTDPERYVTILVDEMKVQEDLVWDKNTGKLIGFIDLGDANINESTITDSHKLASHVMVFIVKSVKNPMSFSFANFATSGASSAQIYLTFWKAVSILEIQCNLKVVATVAGFYKSQIC